MDDTEGAVVDSDPAPPKFKISPLRVPADDCPAQTTTGETVFLHEGEWVEVLPIQTYGLWIAAQKIARSADEASYDEYCDLLSKRVTAWDFTDVAGDPLPQPWRNPEVLRSLSAPEQFWLLRAMEGDTEGQRKNGSGGSGATTSTKARSRKKP